MAEGDMPWRGPCQSYHGPLAECRVGGMREVTKAEFFATVGQLDAHPNCSLSTEYSVWEIRGTRQVVGRSYPGWKNPGEPKRYFVNG